MGDLWDQKEMIQVVTPQPHQEVMPLAGPSYLSLGAPAQTAKGCRKAGIFSAGEFPKKEGGASVGPESSRSADADSSLGQPPRGLNDNYWMKKIKAGDASGPVVPPSQYLQLRGERLEGNPRATDEYRELCCERVGLRAVVDQERYSHLYTSDDVDLVRWVVKRGAGCFWVHGTPRTAIRGFKHRLRKGSIKR